MLVRTSHHGRKNSIPRNGIEKRQHDRFRCATSVDIVGKDGHAGVADMRIDGWDHCIAVDGGEMGGLGDIGDFVGRCVCNGAAPKNTVQPIIIAEPKQYFSVRF